MPSCVSLCDGQPKVECEDADFKMPRDKKILNEMQVLSFEHEVGELSHPLFIISSMKSSRVGGLN